MTAPQDDSGDRELQQVLRQLLEAGAVEGTAAGIARQVLARGEGGLSERQEWVFNTQVRSKYVNCVCQLCEDLIPLAEVSASWANGGYCASCARILGRATGEGVS